MTDTPFRHRPPREWRQITITLLKKHSETLCALLAPLVTGGIEIKPGRANAVPPKEKIIIYVAADAAGEKTLAAIGALVDDMNQRLRCRARLKSERVIEEDWNQAWKRHFTPFHLSRSIVIKPTWEDYAPGPGEKVIELDPGMAFGTGHHASTRLALTLIEELMGATVIETMCDVGCGTGILGMGAALLGAETVIALDNDPDARAAAAANIAANGLDGVMIVVDEEAATLDGPFDLVCANITADVLTELAPALTALTAAEGHLILSGILAGEQETAITALYSRLGMRLIDRGQADEWAALLWRREQG